MKNWVRLLKNVLALAIVGVVVFMAYRYFSQSTSSDFAIEDTPIRIEQVRSIAEISTVSYSDEVVQDSIEFYETRGEQVSGNVLKMVDLDYWKYGIRASNIKRRLTLIVKGEVRIGFDLTNVALDVEQKKDTLLLTLPKPKVIDVLLAPSKTEVFQENGEWNDNARKILELQGKAQLVANAEKFDLFQKAEKQMTTLLRSIYPGEKELIVWFRE